MDPRTGEIVWCGSLEEAAVAGLVPISDEAAKKLEQVESEERLAWLAREHEREVAVLHRANARYADQVMVAKRQARARRRAKAARKARRIQR